MKSLWLVASTASTASFSDPGHQEAYLADVMARLAELKLRFRLRMAVPILEAPWRKKLHSSLPVPQRLGPWDGWTLGRAVDLLGIELGNPQ